MRPAIGAFTHTIYLQSLTVGKGMVQQLLTIRITQARIWVAAFKQLLPDSAAQRQRRRRREVARLETS